jgi:RTX calcium-binding nonapeptide repeat (4 copies)
VQRAEEDGSAPRRFETFVRIERVDARVPHPRRSGGDLRRRRVIGEELQMSVGRLAGIVAAVTVVAMLGSVGEASAGGRKGCTIRGNNSTEVLAGTENADRICSRGGDDIVHALGGNDVVRGGKGNDIVEGDSGNDRLLGGAGNDTLEGNRGKDTLRGGRGNDTIDVADGASHDRAVGGPGTDTCIVNKADRARGCETVNVIG